MSHRQHDDLEPASGCLFWVLAMALVWALLVLALMTLHTCYQGGKMRYALRLLPTTSTLEVLATALDPNSTKLYLASFDVDARGGIGSEVLTDDIRKAMLFETQHTKRCWRGIRRAPSDRIDQTASPTGRSPPTR